MPGYSGIRRHKPLLGAAASSIVSAIIRPRNLESWLHRNLMINSFNFVQIIINLLGLYLIFHNNNNYERALSHFKVLFFSPKYKPCQLIYL